MLASGDAHHFIMHEQRYFLYMYHSLSRYITFAKVHLTCLCYNTRMMMRVIVQSSRTWVKYQLQGTQLLVAG